MTCIKCGKELAQDSKFCTACGAAQRQETPAGQDGKKRKRPGLLWVIVGLAAALGLILFCGIRLLSAGEGEDDPSYAWLNGEGALLVASDLREETEGVPVSDRAGACARMEFSPDGAWLYFTQGSEPDGEDEVADLYRVSLTGKVEENRREKLGSDVVSFRLPESSVLWLEKWGGNYRLYRLDGEEECRLATLSEPAYELDEEEGFVYYRTYEDDAGPNGVNLCRVSLTGGESETLAEDVSTVWGDWTGEFLFTRWEEETRSYAVYQNAGGEPVRLADGVSEDRLMDVETGDGTSFCCLTAKKENYRLSELVTDRYAEEDAETLSAAVEVAYPKEPDEPDWEDYGPDRAYKEADGEWYYVSLNGEKTYHMEATPEFIYEMTGFEVTEQMIDMYKPFLSESIMSEVALYMGEILWERACAQYETELETWYGQLDAYYAAMNSAEQAYREAMAREMIRESLKGAEQQRTVGELYRFEKGERILLASGLELHSLVESEGIFLYDKLPAEIGPLADVSELESADEALALLEGELSRIERCQNVDGTERVLELEAGAAVERMDVLGGDEVLLRVWSDGELSLRVFERGADGLKPADRVIEGGVHPYMSLFEGENGKELFCFQNVERGNFGVSGALWRCVGGNEELLGENVAECCRTDGGEVLFLLTDLQVGGGTLTLLSGDGEPVEVDDEVQSGSVQLLEDGKIFYLRKGDLYLWEKGESARLRKDVSAFRVSGAVPLTVFGPESR